MGRRGSMAWSFIRLASWDTEITTSTSTVGVNLAHPALKRLLYRTLEVFSQRRESTQERVSLFREEMNVTLIRSRSEWARYAWDEQALSANRCE